MTGRRVPWLPALLAASIATNLFLGGMFAGGLLRDWIAPRPVVFASRDSMMFLPRRWLNADLPADQRELIRGAFAADREAIHQRVRDIRAVRREVVDALRAEPFDPERATAAFASLRQRTEEAEAAVHKTIVDVSGRLPVETRERLTAPIARSRGP